MTNLAPYLHFSGTCAEAMNFYKEILGGELTMQKVGETPMAAQMPAEAHDAILHAELKSENFRIMASDMSDTITPGHDVSLAMSGTVEEVKEAWAKFAEEGKVVHELKEEFFGTYGDLVDKYGKPWMFQADPAPQA